MTPTHITADGTPVRITTPASPGYYTVVTRTGLELIHPERELIPMDSAEAEELLEGLGLRLDVAVQEDDSNRTTLARWAQVLEAARSTLQDATAEVLAMSGNDGPGWTARRRLEKALVDAGERLASFRP